MKWIILSGLLVLGLALSSQPLVGSVYDSESNDPVPGAHFIVLNSSMGTSSDSLGSFQLNDLPNEPFQVSISHIGYQTVRISSEELKKTSKIYLTPSVEQLKSVEIQSREDKSWKRSFKRFEKMFLGNSDNAKSCDIINPWVLNFHEEGGFLHASSDKPILIKNNSLGYELLYWLERFKMGRTSLDLGGKAAFKELIPQNKDQEMLWLANRMKTFYGSKAHFFRSLSQDQLEEHGFDIYGARSIGGRVQATRKLSAQDILSPDFKVRFSEFVKIIYRKQKAPMAYLNDPIFSLQPQNSSRHSNLDQAFATDHEMARMEGDDFSADRSQSSLLFLRNSGLQLDPEGILLNDAYLIEYGFWAWTRVGDLLPNNFVPPNWKPTKAKQEVQLKNRFRLDNLTIPVDEILSGGVPRDGIPSIDHPDYRGVKEVDYLEDHDLVLGIVYKGVARAYPVRILNFHEIVNEENYFVTYCPLCFSGVVFDNLVANKRLEFGVSGLLYNSDVLMYDRQTESLWSQLGQAAVSGNYSGKQLRIIPSGIYNWKDWKEKFPDSHVLSTNTGYSRNYNYNPYAGYGLTDRTMFPVINQSDQLANKTQVIGISLNGISKAYPLAILKTKTLISDKVGSTSITIEQKGSETIVKTSRGEVVPATLLYWFAWYAFHPDTEIYK